MLTIINLAIGIAFIYLLFSLVVTAFNEIWLSFLDKRAAFLQEGLTQLLQDNAKVTEFLKHGLIDSLSRKSDGFPAYIPAEAFTAAVLDLIKKPDSTAEASRTLADFKSAIDAMPVAN